MIEFLQLPENQRRQVIEQANARTGMSLKAVEKDWWAYGRATNHTAPPASMGQFRQDYETMLTEMIYGDAPDFDTLIDQLRNSTGC
ncbi:MAG TPA: hypothetical protein VGM30_12995 [Puia sp.]